jgi:hypothetical protein
MTVGHYVDEERPSGRFFGDGSVVIGRLYLRTRWFHDAIFRVGSAIFSNASTISCGFPSYRANGLEEGATGSSGEWVEQGTNKRVCT